MAYRYIDNRSEDRPDYDVGFLVINPNSPESPNKNPIIV
jgi:hypothetical protein